MCIFFSLTHICATRSFFMVFNYSGKLFTPVCKEVFILIQTMLAEKCQGVIRRRNKVTRARRRNQNTNRNLIVTVSRATIASQAMERNQSTKRARKRRRKSSVAITGCSMCQKGRLVIMFTLTVAARRRRRRIFSGRAR